MSKTNYKRLGDYIREVDIRNRDLKVTKLLGLSMTKQFRPSTSNIVGVDLSKYKVVDKNVFAFDPMSVIRVHKVPIALNSDNLPIIVSPAYITFKSIDENILDARYLMMWFRRNEFDRYADFKSDASVRGGYNWNELCETQIILPSIDQQRKIVAEYNAIQQRIKLNEQLIVKLEETAQAIYRKMFVDGIDKNNLPEGWRKGVIGDLLELQRGFDLPTQCRRNGKYPIYASTGIAGFHDEFKIKPPCVITGRSGSIGNVFFVDEKCWPLNTTLWVKNFKDTPPFFVYYKLKELELDKTIAGFAAVPTLNRNDVHMMETLIPSKDILLKFEKMMQIKFYNQKLLTLENLKLADIKRILFS